MQKLFINFLIWSCFQWSKWFGPQVYKILQLDKKSESHHHILWDQQPWHDIIIAQPIWYEECLTFVRLFLQWLHQKCHYFYKKVSLVLWNISTWQVGSRVLVCKFWTVCILFDEISSSNYLQLAFIFVGSDALINRLFNKDLNPQNKGYLKFINSPGF